MPETVVTATGRPEPVTSVAGTVQVIDGEKITRSTARSVTDLLSENAVGFMSQWTQGQTSLNIRGGATEGQGRDYKSEVLILINGHRAGTANISKLSVADVERIEIVRGPASVIYGSQNMGGVVNIILKTGRTAPGTLAEMDAGSFGLIEGRLQNGGTYKGVDWYLGLSGGKQDDYQVGGGQVELNTAWSRMGGTGAVGWQIDDDNRIDTTIRTDGVYGAGFRGSSANIFAFDTRYNQSIDVSYNGKTPDGRGHLFAQGYYVQDVDDLNNPSPLTSLIAPPARTFTDHNHRRIDIEGVRVQPRYRFWPSNELLAGVDWERSWIISYRFRAGGPAVTQLSPQDNNETDNVWALYAEDAQKLFDDRLTVRAGVRQTWGTTSLLATPNAPTLIPGSVDYRATTWSVGTTLQVTGWLTGRFGASSGFRAPTATELGANFTTTPIGNTIFGNPNLSPETSHQLELGGTIATKNARLDLALFQNVISNRIQSVRISSQGGVVVSQYQNNPGDILIQGLELQAEADIPRLLGLSVGEGERWSLYGNGYYNFTMTDYGAELTGANSSQATRINRYGLSIGTRYERLDGELPWSVQLLGVLRGPMWYNTEEALSPVYFPGQVRNVTVYEKSAFWVWSTRLEIEPHKGVTFFAAINNILDVNQDPVFIALDQNPCRANLAAQNGSCGNSMMGREVVAGVRVRF
ncbi:TonB-dependent receptor [Enhydrobacter sp.]|uniref:TonB-dependent receptor n=1 Tax=Enhydrobacter sp. TaxID=1894999 RepID=UPI00260A1A30|nr:TonB-dependent receptor [Enhydrobacter sp.]WIM09057.1 MAG: Outer membrane vitamin B12 receptor BtuB [Enhydrobacter sp.]